MEPSEELLVRFRQTGSERDARLAYEGYCRAAAATPVEQVERLIELTAWLLELRQLMKERDFEPDDPEQFFS